MPYMNWGDFKAKVEAAGVTDQDDVDITSFDTCPGQELHSDCRD
jgi:hypothetical protein